VVGRQYVFGSDEQEKFRTFMRMQENFSGCRVLSYCVMSNHFHMLLEVPPMPAEGISEEELLKRLKSMYAEAVVAEVAKELAEARKAGNQSHVEEIFSRYTYRMHDLSEFMKALLIRFTRWFNRTHKRTGTLWEERFKSVIVESGVAARTIAAYIDLNPVRAGIVADPAEYRWSSYGEATGGGPKGNGKKARAGLVRACMSSQGAGFEAEKWQEVSRIYRRILGLALQRNHGRSGVKSRGGVTTNKQEMSASGENETVLPDLPMAAMLHLRIRYFSAGAVIGSRAFVNEAFLAARERFSPKRKEGARRMRGKGKPAAGILWSARDLRVAI
jgi:REP element-mobilizing transposase RayT